MILSCILVIRHNHIHDVVMKFPNNFIASLKGSKVTLS